MQLAYMIGRNRRTIMPDCCMAFMFPMFCYGCSIMAKLEYSSVRITPSMKFHSPFMGFINHEFERIIEWNGCFSLLSHQPFAPGFNGRREKSITCRTYLNNHRIHSIVL